MLPPFTKPCHLKQLLNMLQPSYQIKFEEGKYVYYAVVKTARFLYRLPFRKSLVNNFESMEEVVNLWVKLNVVPDKNRRKKVDVFIKPKDVADFIQKHFTDFGKPVLKPKAYSRYTEAQFPPHWKEKIKGKWDRYKRRCIDTKREFTLTHNQFELLLCSSCVYCGEINIPTIDRKNSNIGYTLENCQPCCNICNTMKRNYSDKLFKEIILKIAKYSKLI